MRLFGSDDVSEWQGYSSEIQWRCLQVEDEVISFTKTEEMLNILSVVS